MTSSQQRAALHRQIWAIANDVRGAVDGWDFKQYVLDALFYRFISEGLPRETELRQQQYEYYRDQLLSFPKPDTATATE